jgi:hypothetical protein
MCENLDKTSSQGDVGESGSGGFVSFLFPAGGLLRQDVRRDFAIVDIKSDARPHAELLDDVLECEHTLNGVGDEGANILALFACHLEVA